MALRGNKSWYARNAGRRSTEILEEYGKYTAAGQTSSSTINTAYSGQNGTGGLLILYADTLYNSGDISSDGSKGGSGNAGGGSSGGGSINIFAKVVAENGIQTSTGGVSVAGGGKGGNGAITVNELGSVLNYPEKRILLKLNETYQIDQTKLSYTKLNQIQTLDLSIGNIVFDKTDDKDIITVNNLGTITANKTGVTKVKITDETNENSTYIIVEVLDNGTTSKIKNGNTHTLTLKENGTIWTYGNNGVVTTNEPIQVEKMKDIVDIGAGNKMSIALDKDGNVYTWGICYYNQTSSVVKEPKKEELLSNIRAVDTYGENFYAVGENGILYIWGKGYAEPTRVESNIKYIDIEGKLLLGENGLVYNIENPEQRIRFLSGIGEIAYEDDHYAGMGLDGLVYNVGTGNVGQLGNGKSTNSQTPVIARTSDGYLKDVYEISLGGKSGGALTLRRKSLCMGGKQ